MGANNFEEWGFGASATEVFDELKEKSHWRSGHEYSGEIGMKDNFILVQLPSGFRYNMFDKYMDDVEKRETIRFHNLDRIRNKQWIEELLSKETEPKQKREYQKRIKKLSKEERIPKSIIPEKYQKWCKQIYELREGDKWGPALAIELTGSFKDQYKERHGLKGKRGKLFVFMGYAPS